MLPVNNPCFAKAPARSLLCRSTRRSMLQLLLAAAAAVWHAHESTHTRHETCVLCASGRKWDLAKVGRDAESGTRVIRHVRVDHQRRACRSSSSRPCRRSNSQDSYTVEWFGYILRRAVLGPNVNVAPQEQFTRDVSRWTWGTARNAGTRFFGSCKSI